MKINQIMGMRIKGLSNEYAETWMPRYKRMKLYGIMILSSGLLAANAGQASELGNLSLHYDAPAKDWESECLPIVYGQMGAMLFGQVEQERIQFNEESLWIGNEDDTGAYQNFGEVLMMFENGGPIVTNPSNHVSAGTQSILESVYTRLHDGDTAMAVLETHLKTHPNPTLLARFTPFCDSQIVGNMGHIAASAEMLLHSQSGEIELLPALPKVWANGKVTGLRARGGFTVDIEWKDSKVTNYRIASSKSQDVNVRMNGELRTVKAENL